MNLNPVKSKNIKAMGYDPETKTLEVEFHEGKIYQYKDVSEKTFENFQQADSIGGHFAKHIQGSFKFEKLQPKEKKK